MYTFTGYLVFKKPSSSFKPLGARLAVKKPAVSANEIFIKVEFNLPESLFIRPQLFAKITVPDTNSHIELTPDIAESIEKAVRESAGITIKILE